MITALLFQKYFDIWKNETSHISDITKIHAALEPIVCLGISAIPLILGKLEEEPSFLFFALQDITGENPVQKEHIGDILKMVEDWINWGHTKCYPFIKLG